MAVELPTVQPSVVPELSAVQIRELSGEVRALAAERNAVILAHNYQVPEVQDAADLTGTPSSSRARRRAPRPT